MNIWNQKDYQVVRDAMSRLGYTCIGPIGHAATRWMPLSSETELPEHDTTRIQMALWVQGFDVKVEMSKSNLFLDLHHVD